MGKIIGKLKHNYTIMHINNSKLSFLKNNAAFHHFHQVYMNSTQFPQFKTFRYNSGTIAIEEKSYNKRYLSLSFSKYKKTSPKLVHSYVNSSMVMHAKFQLISTQVPKCKGVESRQVAHRKSHWQAKWVKSWES